MNKSGVKTALILILVSVLMSFFGKMFVVGGIFGGSLQTLVIGLGIALFSPLLVVGGVLYAVYSYFRNPVGNSAAYSDGGVRVFEHGGFLAYCRYCGKVILRDGMFCSYCGREQS